MIFLLKTPALALCSSVVVCMVLRFLANVLQLYMVTYLLLGRFTDKLTVVVFQGVSHTLNLIAEGQGTTIVSQPPLHPTVDLGPHFSSRPCSQQFVLTNCGRRKHSLYWVTEGFSIVKHRRAEIANETTDTLDIGLAVIH